MNPLTLLDIALWIIASLFALLALLSALGLRLSPALSPERDDPATPEPVHIVVPVRNERERIGQTIERILAQRAADWRATIVDDRSDDGTSDILREIAGRDPRLSVHRVEALPDGWLGKCHACAVGAAHARTPWILFMDADTWLEPDALRLALGRAQRTGAGMLCVMPGFVRTTFWGRAALLGAMGAFMARACRTTLDLPGGYLGVGAFNLVRADAYRAAGGHETLRMEVVDDVALGLLIRRAGARVRIALSPAHLETDWAGSVRSLIGVLEKNGWAAVGFRWSPALAVAGWGVAATALALAGPALWLSLGLTGGLAAGATLWLNALPAIAGARRLGWAGASALAAPLTYPVLSVALLNSVRACARERGVRWRDTRYELSELREAWLRVRKRPRAQREHADTMR